MFNTVKALKSAYNFGSVLNLVYNGVQRLCVIEEMKPTYIRVKQLNGDRGYRTFTIDKVSLGEGLTYEESIISRNRQAGGI